MERCRHFARGHGYVLQCDIHQFFPAIDHEVLRTLLARRIADPEVLWLIDLILDGGAGLLEPVYAIEWFPGDDLLALCRPRGLPIGNLTSQNWANAYLDPLDHFVKQQLGCKAYVRYCDDFLLFHDDKNCLHAWKQAVQDYLDSVRLKLNWRRSEVYPTSTGIPFLGYRIFPDHMRLRSDNLRLARKRLRRNRDLYITGKLTAAHFRCSLQSWIAHAAHADTYRLRQRMLADIRLAGGHHART